MNRGLLTGPASYWMLDAVRVMIKEILTPVSGKGHWDQAPAGESGGGRGPWRDVDTVAG